MCRFFHWFWHCMLLELLNCCFLVIISDRCEESSCKTSDSYCENLKPYTHILLASEYFMESNASKVVVYIKFGPQFFIHLILKIKLRSYYAAFLEVLYFPNLIQRRKEKFSYCIVKWHFFVAYASWIYENKCTHPVVMLEHLLLNIIWQGKGAKGSLLKCFYDYKLWLQW